MQIGLQPELPNFDTIYIYIYIIICLNCRKLLVNLPWIYDIAIILHNNINYYIHASSFVYLESKRISLSYHPCIKIDNCNRIEVEYFKGSCKFRKQDMLRIFCYSWKVFSLIRIILVHLKRYPHLFEPPRKIYTWKKKRSRTLFCSDIDQSFQR